MLLQLSEHQTKTNNLIGCKHCGETCNGKITDGLHPFCCEGCKQVFFILQETNSCSPAQMQQLTGITPKGRFVQDKWNYLDEPEIASKLISFTDKELYPIYAILYSYAVFNAVSSQKNAQK